MQLTSEASSSTNQPASAFANSVLPARVPEKQESSFAANSSFRYEDSFINPYSELEKIKTHIEDLNTKMTTASADIRDSDQETVALQNALEALNNRRMEAETHLVEYEEELKKWEKKEAAFRNLLDVIEE